MKQLSYAFLFLFLVAFAYTPLMRARSQASYPVTLGWDANDASDLVNKYHVYQSADGKTFVKVAESTSTTATLQLAPARYFFHVTAVNAWGESGASNVVQTPPGLPQTVRGATIIIVIK